MGKCFICEYLTISSKSKVFISGNDSYELKIGGEIKKEIRMNLSEYYIKVFRYYLNT